VTQSARHLAAWLRDVDRWDENWPKEACLGILQAALQSEDAVAGAMYQSPG
jgi:P2-related tail formation protein